MKFSASILSASLALASLGSAAAFVGVRPASMSALRPLGSTAEQQKVETSATTPSSAAAEPPAAPPAEGLNDASAATISPAFAAARDAAAAKLSASIPDPSLAKPLLHFLAEYFAALDAAAASGKKNPDGSDVDPSQAAAEFRQCLGFGMKYGLGVGSPEGKKFTFDDVRWRALRGEEDDGRYGDELKEVLGDDADVDFYATGCDFFRPAMDLEKSLVLGEDNVKKAMEQLAAGENVVFLANHQSEADPQVVSCLFEKLGEEAGELAASVTYVAGHKVTTDPLAVPFSMGRNLIDADPETKPAKSRQNMSAMNSMLAGLKEGGMAIWVAPSGGRDRRDVATGKIPVAPFDQKTVDMFRLMGNKSRTPTHFYPMSMVSYDLCPPPDFVEAGVGELRNVRFTPVGIRVCDEIPNVGGAEKRHLFSEKAEEECAEGYVELLRGMGMERYVP